MHKPVAYRPTDGLEVSNETLSDEGGRAAYGERQIDGVIRRWEEHVFYNPRDLHQYASSAGSFDQPISPGALPPTLRFLQFNKSYNQPLQVGNIPEGVEVLQFGRCFNRSLAPGHLPASLIYLVLGEQYDKPLLPGALPAGLRRLHVGGYYDHPLLPDALPPQLQQLSLGSRYTSPSTMVSSRSQSPTSDSAICLNSRCRPAAYHTVSCKSS